LTVSKSSTFLIVSPYVHAIICYYTIFHHQFSSGFPQKWCYHQAAFYMIGGMSDVREKATGNRGAVFRNVTRATKLWGLVQVFIVIAEAAKLAAVAAGK
jgi:hypothetical protein